MAAAYLHVVVVDQPKAMDFARVAVRPAKTYAPDEPVLVYFDEAVDPAVRPLQNPDRRELNTLTSRGNHLMTMPVPKENRL